MLDIAKFLCDVHTLIHCLLQEAASVVPVETAAGSSTHDLECSHSERSIDDAIEKSSASGTLSPISPTPMMDGRQLATYMYYMKTMCIIVFIFRRGKT